MCILICIILTFKDPSAAAPSPGIGFPAMNPKPAGENGGEGGEEDMDEEELLLHYASEVGRCMYIHIDLYMDRCRYVRIIFVYTYIHKCLCLKFVQYVCRILPN
jgi:hypothetical protein